MARKGRGYREGNKHSREEPCSSKKSRISPVTPAEQKKEKSKGKGVGGGGGGWQGTTGNTGGDGRRKRRISSLPFLTRWYKEPWKGGTEMGTRIVGGERRWSKNRNSGTLRSSR